MALTTNWSAGMGLRVPIVNAPMGGVAGGRLAAAVTAAGGLGMIGMGSAATARALRAELDELGAVTGPFGIGLVDWVMAGQPELFDAALAARPSLLSVSFGTDFGWVERAHGAGITTATQVYDRTGALRAVDAGVDVLVARGAEGGGHGAMSLATLPLLDVVLDAVPVPVLAAGGIGSPRSVAAVLAAGAAGAWLGTRLSACAEALSSPRARAALIDADETATATTRVFDLGQDRPWPARFPSRVLVNDFLTRWAGRAEELDDDARAELAAAIAADDFRIAPVDAGQGVAMVTAEEPAAAVIDRLCVGAAQLLARWG
ncbi:nitronate monooxygenase [Mycolicibacillus trivialis]